MSAELLEQVRREAGLTQEELAVSAGTSRTTVSAYEHGRKSPTLTTFERLLASAGFQLSAQPRVNFAEREMQRGRPIFVPDHLWRLPLAQAFATVSLPLGLNWSRASSTVDLADRRQRARCYEVILREGMPGDLLRFIDGALLIDLWTDLVLPRDVRSAWQPLIYWARR